MTPSTKSKINLVRTQYPQAPRSSYFIIIHTERKSSVLSFVFFFLLVQKKSSDKNHKNAHAALVHYGCIFSSILGQSLTNLYDQHTLDLQAQPTAAVSQTTAL